MNKVGCRRVASEGRSVGSRVGGAWAVGGAAERGGGWSSPEAATAEAAVAPAAAAAAARVGPVDLPVVDRPLVETVPFLVQLALVPHSPFIR